MAVKTYKARVERVGKVWAVEVEGVGPTQARTLRELDEMTTDLIETLVDDPGEFTVTYAFVMPTDAAEHLARRDAIQSEAERLQREAAAEYAAAAAALAVRMSQRDAGTLLGVSHQRVHQLVQEASAHPVGAGAAEVTV